MPRAGADRSRRAALVTAGVIAAGAASVLGAGLTASACTETLLQPDDAGNFTDFDGNHPAPTAPGAPCEIDVYLPAPCCGAVAKTIPGRECFGCAGKIAFALCVGGGFSCACRCDLPEGYLLVDEDENATDCGGAGTDAPSDSTPESSSEGGPVVDAQAGG